MKISKKHFIEQITTNKTIFLGIVRKQLTDDEVLTALSDFLKSDKTLHEQRTAKANSNSITFSNGSKLYFNSDNKKEYNLISNNILSLTEFYTCDDKSLSKALYYYIV